MREAWETRVWGKWLVVTMMSLARYHVASAYGSEFVDCEIGNVAELGQRKVEQ